MKVFEVKTSTGTKTIKADTFEVDGCRNAFFRSSGGLVAMVASVEMIELVGEQCCGAPSPGEVVNTCGQTAAVPPTTEPAP